MTKQTVNVFLIAVLFFGAGFLTNGLINTNTTTDEPADKTIGPNAMEHGHSMDESMPHEHGTMQHGKIIAEAPQPTIDLIVHEDPVAGWNLQLKTENFTFAPTQAGFDHEAGKGHAHLYIDGAKITRLYGEWYHIPSLETGTHQIKVTLNSNNHDELTTSKDEVIMDTEIIEVN